MGQDRVSRWKSYCSVTACQVVREICRYMTGLRWLDGHSLHVRDVTDTDMCVGLMAVGVFSCLLLR